MHGTCGINMAMFSHNKDAIKEVIAKILNNIMLSWLLTESISFN